MALTVELWSAAGQMAVFQSLKGSIDLLNSNLQQGVRMDEGSAQRGRQYKDRMAGLQAGAGMTYR